MSAAFRDTILIVEKGKAITTSIEDSMREKGYFTIRIEKPDTLLPLLDSLDRIRAILFVDNDKWGTEGYSTLRLLKGISHDLPLVFSTAENSPEKEQKTRDLGIFYYHTEDMGLENLLTTLVCAVEKSIQEDIFLNR